MIDKRPDSAEAGLMAESAKSATEMDAERWLAAIVESSDDAILGESLSGLITSWNAGATRIFGYSAEEAMGKPISWFAWPGEEGRVEELLRRLRLGELRNYSEAQNRQKSHRLAQSVAHPGR
jgi:PAS domain S-box-containing protein